MAIVVPGVVVVVRRELSVFLIRVKSVIMLGVAPWTGEQHKG